MFYNKIEIAERIVELLMDSGYIPTKPYAEYSDLTLDIQDVLSKYVDAEEVEDAVSI